MCNILNMRLRHCRIGKVTLKSRPTPLVDPLKFWEAEDRNWWNDPHRPIWAAPGTGYVNPLTSWTC